MKAIRRFNVRSVLPEAISELGELAINLRWSWHTASRNLFAETEPVRWEKVGHDPVALLSSLSAKELERLAADPDYVAKVKAAYADLQAYVTGDRWYQRWAREVGSEVPQAIAYFSAEFGITEVLPQYSGGLGILAGDHLKSASDLGVPVIGVGLFYQTGYFAQSLNRDGWQQETYPVLDPDGLPLSLLRDADGKPAAISLSMPGHRTLRAFVWKAQVGRIPLLLLDSDVHENDPDLRSVTNRLYGGGGEQRLLQEMLLGIGGVRALRLYSAMTGAPEPDVYHCNEGHAGFLGIERIHELVTQRGLTFDEAREATRAATVFTTHTPVPAGIDRFGADQIRHYFGGDNALDGVPMDKLLALGAETYPGGDGGVFNMAVMGLRMAKHANGVSQLHGIVSRDMFHGLWPGFDDTEVPITSITNGVHAPTWVDQRIFDVGASFDPAEESSSGKLALFAANASDEQIWSVKRALRHTLVDMARERTKESWVRRGASPAELGWTQDILDPDVLTIGFARRVPTYKRLTLMLRDPARLKKILLDPQRPVQLVIAGKSHPADDNGKRLIQKMVQFADDPTVRHRIVFLPNYDIGMARHLYPGCDVWLNNPLRPLEACGTSGMKAALNGGLNLSILDGWWDEWYDGQNGWEIPTADGVTDPDRRDDIEAAALYDLIENRVAGPARRHRGGGALRPHREPGRAALLRRGRGRGPASVGGDDAAHAGHAGAEGAGHPPGAGLHDGAVQARRGRLPHHGRPGVRGSQIVGGLPGSGGRELGEPAHRPRGVGRSARCRAGRGQLRRPGVRVAGRPAPRGYRRPGGARPRRRQRPALRHGDDVAAGRGELRGRPASVRGRPQGDSDGLVRLHRAHRSDAQGHGVAGGVQPGGERLSPEAGG